jgi:exoribonuclease R
MLRCNVLQDKEQDIVIEGMRNRNRALEGDEVAVRLNPESEWKVREIFV